jgi:hypothetical protein
MQFFQRKTQACHRFESNLFLFDPLGGASQNPHEFG